VFYKQYLSIDKHSSLTQAQGLGRLKSCLHEFSGPKLFLYCLTDAPFRFVSIIWIGTNVQIRILEVHRMEDFYDFVEEKKYTSVQ
jgi:hypothetical protein